MEIREGHIYEGYVSALGSDGPSMRWIVVSPFDKRHAHSIGEPLELHCMPFGILQQHVELGTLSFIESAPDHPVIQLQRVKETHRLHDTHLGLCGEPLATMLTLLEGAVAESRQYAPYLAGEILSTLDRSRYGEQETQQITDRVHQILGKK